MVLADPGMGKSTLLKNETIIKIREALKQLENKSVDNLVFPLFIRLSELARETGEIIDIIPNILKQDYPEIIDQIEYYLQEKLQQGKCLLLFDALDEVPKDDRIPLSKRLNRFLKNYPCPIICTSRIVGYGGNFIDGGKEVEIVPFDDKKTAEYIKTWFNYAAGKIEDEMVSADGLINELKNRPQIQGLAQNPLLLSLLCSLYQSKGLILPARRTQVYEKAVNYILSQWSKDNQRKLSDEGWIIAKTNLLEYLAYEFSCQNQEVFSGKELYDKINEYLGQTDKREFNQKTATELITELTEEDGIIQTLSAEGNQYLFLHRTFQEYFTASYLKEEIQKNKKEGLELIQAHFWEYDWHETIILVAGLLKNPIPLLKKLRQEKDDIFKTMLLLAGSCLTECSAQVKDQKKYDSLKNEIIEDIVNFWHKYPDAEFIKSVLISLGKIGNEVAVNSLIQALSNSDSQVRCIAEKALGKIGNEAAVNALIQALSDSNINVRSSAAYELGNIGNQVAVNPLIQALTDSEPVVRDHAAFALGKIGDEAAVNPLIQALTDPDLFSSFWEWKASIVEALGKIGSEAAVNPLIQALTDRDPFSAFWECKSSIVEALGKIGSEAAVNPLIQTLTDPDDFVVISSVVKALIRIIGNEAAVNLLIQALSDYNSNIRYSAAYALGKIGNQEAVNLLIQALTDSNSWVRRCAAKALGDIRNEEAVNGLIQALTDSNRNVRYSAADALGDIRNEEAVNGLIQAFLSDSDSNVRYSAADALGDIRNEEAVNGLIQALSDSDSNVRYCAAFALGKIGNEEAVNGLIQALSDSEPGVRYRAAFALGNMGNQVAVNPLIRALTHFDMFCTERIGIVMALGKIDNEAAVNALIQVLSDSEPGVRYRAAFALGNIGNKAAVNPLIEALSDSNSEVRYSAAYALENIKCPEILEAIIKNQNIDIYKKNIFTLARKLAIRYSRYNLPYIPVYPHLVGYFPIKRLIKGLLQR
ncbi:MAG: HEAT repeat domain-containing protein [Crocosphaera sp.]|nr:HEAT repeat domain-containing protein [Crocosphaera sp.]